MEMLEKRLDSAKKRLKADKKAADEIKVLEKIKTALEQGKCARTVELTDEEKEQIKDLYLLTYI